MEYITVQNEKKIEEIMNCLMFVIAFLLKWILFWWKRKIQTNNRREWKEDKYDDSLRSLNLVFDLASVIEDSKFWFV